MNDVVQEVKGQERAFGVLDLRAQVTELGKVGGEAAWTISYSTSRTSIEKLSAAARIGGESAWTISYSTALTGVEKGSEKSQAR